MPALLRLCALLITPPSALSAAVFDGGGLQQGVQEAQGIQGVSKMDILTLIINAIIAVTNLLGLLAAVSIIVCGIMLIFSLGNEETAGKAKKGVMYSVIGLLIIIFAKAIITFITQLG